jgi:hypothetical protein
LPHRTIPIGVEAVHIAEADGKRWIARNKSQQYFSTDPRYSAGFVTTIGKPSKLKVKTDVGTTT